MTNSRQKGKRGELEAAAALRDLGFAGARRGQQFKGGTDSPDLVDAIPGVHIEVKREEAFRMWAALEQAERERGPDEAVMVMHRRNRTEWVCIIPLKHLKHAAFEVFCGTKDDPRPKAVEP